jgi:hypothetical protein
MAMNPGTHEVFNQSTPFSDVNLLAGNPALADALRFNHPQLDLTALHASAPSWGRRRCSGMRGWPTPFRRSSGATTALASASTRSSSTRATTHLLAAALRHRLHGDAVDRRLPARMSSARRPSCCSPNASRRSSARCR